MRIVESYFTLNLKDDSKCSKVLSIFHISQVA